MNQYHLRTYFLFIAFSCFCLLAGPVAMAQYSGAGLGNSIGSRPLNGGATRNGIGSSRLQISNGISNGSISLDPNAPTPGPALLPGTGITTPTVSTFGSPGGGGPGGGGVGGGGYNAAPLDGGIMILIVLGIGLLLQMGLKEARKRQ